MTYHLFLLSKEIKQSWLISALALLFVMVIPATYIGLASSSSPFIAESAKDVANELAVVFSPLAPGLWSMVFCGAILEKSPELAYIRSQHYALFGIARYLFLQVVIVGFALWICSFKTNDISFLAGLATRMLSPLMVTVLSVASVIVIRSSFPALIAAMAWSIVGYGLHLGWVELPEIVLQAFNLGGRYSALLASTAITSSLIFIIYLIERNRR